MFEFQFSYFVRERFVDSSPESIFPLITAFENNFLPSCADEVSPNGVRKVIRMVGINDFDNIAVLFSSEAININMLYRDVRPSKEQVIAKLDFIVSALSKIKSNTKAWRIASVVTSIEKATQSYNSKMYSKYLSDGASDVCFEWNVRQAKKTQINSEILNIVTSLSRGPVMNSANPTESFDAVVVQLDVNTAPENASERFEVSNGLAAQLVDMAVENIDIVLA